MFQKQVIVASSPGRLRNVGKKGARLGVKVTVRGGAGNAVGVVRATGPWQIIEFDTKAHRLPRERRRKASGPVSLGPDRVYSNVNHPGTKGKHLFGKAAIAARPLLPKVYQRELILAMAKIF